MVYLFACKGGAGEEGKNVAWAFAKKTDALVRATTTSVSYSNLFGKYHARVDEDSFFNPTKTWGDYIYQKKWIFLGDEVAKSYSYNSKWAK